MGTQTMDTQGVDSINNRELLVRQNSMYSLTLDEVQIQLGDMGKPLSCMNLDELVKSIWTAQSNLSLGEEVYNLTSTNHLLQQQPCLSLTGPLSKKTVDEVWRDIQQAQIGNNEISLTEKQLTLGEMTLEDFLIKAGVVDEGFLKKDSDDGSIFSLEPSVSPHFSSTLLGQWVQYQPQFQHTQQSMMSVYMSGAPVAQPIPIGPKAVMEMAYAENKISLPSSLMGNLSDPQGCSRKRIARDDIEDKSVDRRQRRMIKNRESAARSRAKKQAYTSELEQAVEQLKEENARLRRMEELKKLLPPPPSEPRYQLRRTSSSHF